MKLKTSIIYIIFLILSLITSAPPPKKKPKPSKVIVEESNPVFAPKSKNLSSFKRLQSAEQSKENSTSIVKFYDTYIAEEHEFILAPKNLPDGSMYKNWGFSISSDGIDLDNVITSCEILNADGMIPNGSDCLSSFASTGENKYIKFTYNYTLYNTNILKVKLKYNKTTDDEILYKTEWVSIPFIGGFSFCNYSFILSEGLVSLGLEENVLKKESDGIYTYYGQCPSDYAADTIRYAPQKGFWKADMETYVKYPQTFSNKVTFRFPRYYRGGKLNNTFYKITSPIDGTTYNEEDIIYQDLNLRVEIAAKGKDIASAKLETGFINDLKNNLSVYFPESYYAINETEIPQVVKDKAQEVVANNTDLPNYYSIGKFLHNYITYDLSYSGRTFTIEQIYNNKRGVCEHYTILYNAMLNSIGIKAMYVAGWAFQGNETSGDEKTVGHAWTAALIDGNWKELDATWGLFEGIPAGHIPTNFFKDSYSYSWFDSGNKTFGQNRTIRLYTNISDIYDISPDEPTFPEILGSTDQTTIMSTEEESSMLTNMETTNMLSFEASDTSFVQSTNTLLEESNNIPIVA